jgi:hypothetical protein
MRKLNYLFATLILAMASSGLFAQDTIKHLIISELRWDGWAYFYVEYTNMHPTDSVWLGDFKYQNFRDKNCQFVQDGEEVRMVEAPGNQWERLPDKMLPPGESFVYMAVQDGWNGTGRKHPRPVHSHDIVKVAEHFTYFPDWNDGDDRFRTRPYLPELQHHGFDSITTSQNTPGGDYGKVFARLAEGCGLIWTSGDTIQVLVDQALAEVNWDLGTMDNDYTNKKPVSTAGIPLAHDDNTLVRKFTIKEGETNWTLAKGQDPASSSWMLLPHFDQIGRMAPKTVGNHGDYQLDYSSTEFVFDDVNMEVTVPWGTEKFDSITNYMDIGPGNSWWYIQNGNEDDSLSMIAKDNDTIQLLAFGNDLQSVKFAVKVAAPTNSDKTVYGKRQRWYPDPEADDYRPEEVSVVGEGREGHVYAIDEYDGVMDTIGYVPFATPVDTFLRLLEWPPNAEVEIVWKSGEPNADVADGDIFRVTAADASTKDYYIQVEDYVASDQVLLSSITWPDRPDFVLPGWGADGLSDTIPGFSSAGTFYEITLPPGTMGVPALVAKTEDVNSSIETVRATSLKGGVDERTTYFHITSETDTSFATVKVIFDVLNPTPQKFVGEPIFSKFYIKDWWGAGGVEVQNPTDVPIDLSNYLIARTQGAGNTSKLSALEMLWDNTDSTNTWRRRYRRYVPGYKWPNWTDWQTNPKRLTADGVVSTFVEPKETFVVWKIHARYDEQRGKVSFFRGNATSIDAPGFPNPGHDSPINVFINDEHSAHPGIFDNPWQERLDPYQSVAWPEHRWSGTDNFGTYYMMKILNDSILLGTKDADDPEDYQVVDVMGSTVVPWNLAGAEMTISGECYLLIRRPHIYFGDTIMGQRNHLTDPDSSQWHVEQTYNSNASMPVFNRTQNQKLLGSNPLDPITGHLSIIYSVAYNASRGFSEAETITGVSKGEDVAAFLANIIKADETQMLEVTDAGGTAKAMGDAVVEGDILVVTSATGNVTKYTISLAAIGGDPSITAADAEITVSAAAPYEVGGFAAGAKLRWVLSKVNKVEATSVINIVDADGHMIPLKVLNADEQYVDVVATAGHIIEVVAEDGTTRQYKVVPDAQASDAFLYSDIFVVLDEPVMLVTKVPFGIGVDALLARLVPSQDATMKLVTATGQQRTLGQVGYGDQVMVTSSDASTTNAYTVQFADLQTAYVTSAVLTVIQTTLVIEGATNTDDVAAFLAKLTPSEGSTIMVMDKDGNEKTEGSMDSTDVLHVITGDKTSEALYTLEKFVLVSTDDLDSKVISIYPNPARDILYVENVPADTYVRVSDIAGRTAILRASSEISKGIDLSDLNDGLYLLSIEKDGEKIMTTRFIKK